MLKNMGFVMLTGAVMAVFFSPILIQSDEAPTSVKKEYVKKEIKKKKKGGCPCGK
jgi:hypothetical protein